MSARLPNLPRKPVLVPYEERWPEHAPTFTLDRQIAAAREAIGEARWRELEADWTEHA